MRRSCFPYIFFEKYFEKKREKARGEVGDRGGSGAERGEEGRKEGLSFLGQKLAAALAIERMCSGFIRGIGARIVSLSYLTVLDFDTRPGAGAGAAPSLDMVIRRRWKNERDLKETNRWGSESDIFRGERASEEKNSSPHAPSFFRSKESERDRQKPINETLARPGLIRTLSLFAPVSTFASSQCARRPWWESARREPRACNARVMAQRRENRVGGAGAGEEEKKKKKGAPLPAPLLMIDRSPSPPPPPLAHSIFSLSLL